MLQWLFINEIVYPVALFLVRNSLLIFYWCLTPSSSHIFRRIVILFFFINFTCMAVSLGTIIWQCNPIDWWNHPLTAKCVDRDATFLAGSILIVLTDVFTLLLPIPLVMSLKLARKEKLMVIGMFLPRFPCMHLLHQPHHPCQGSHRPKHWRHYLQERPLRLRHLVPPRSRYRHHHFLCTCHQGNMDEGRQ